MDFPPKATLRLIFFHVRSRYEAHLKSFRCRFFSDVITKRGVVLLSRLAREFVGSEVDGRTSEERCANEACN